MEASRSWVLFVAAGVALWLVAPVAARAWQPLFCTSSFSGGDFDTDRMRTVYRIGATGTVSPFAVLPAGSEARGLAVDARGNVYTSTDIEGADHYIDRIFRVTPTGQTSIFATFSGPSIQRLAFDHKGNLYAAGGFEVTKISPDGKAKHFAEIPTGEEPSIDGLAIDVHDSLYLSTDAPFHNRIMKVTSRGRQSVFASLRTDEHPGALAFDSRGNLLLAIWNPDCILSFSPAGRRRTFATLPGSSLREVLAIDARGIIYVGDVGGQGILKIGPGGSPVTKFALIEEPMSLAFGPAPKR